MQTPTPIHNKNIGKTSQYQYILDTSENKDTEKKHEDKSLSAIRQKSASNNNISDISSRVFSYQVPYESNFNS